MRILIQNGIIVNAHGRQRADILVENGCITDVAETLHADGAQRIDAADCFVFPGFIDTHTHFDLDLGTTITADNFETGTRAAILGGTTTILDFATQDRGCTMQAALDSWHAKAKNSSCNYGFHMALSEWNDSFPAQMLEMTKAGVTSYKMYMVYPALRVEDDAIYHALRCAGDMDVLIGMHCENWGLLQARIAEQKAQGNLGPAAHPLSRPVQVEAEAIARYLRIAELANAPVYIVHLSTGEGLLEARHARARGQRVYLETCPQYLVLDESRYLAPDAAKYVMSPPLRKQADQEMLWQGLALHEIQTIGTDHCSFTMAQKALGKDDFTCIPNGCAGVQNRPALYYTYGVQPGRVTLEQMAAQLSTHAAKLFGMYPQKGIIAPGSDADIVVWEPAHRETIGWQSLAHNCDNSPYDGMPISGRARHVLLNGVPAVQNGMLSAPKEGRFVHRGVCQHI